VAGCGSERQCGAGRARDIVEIDAAIGADLPLDRGPRVGVGCRRKGCLLAGVDRLIGWVSYRDETYGESRSSGGGCDAVVAGVGEDGAELVAIVAGCGSERQCGAGLAGDIVEIDAAVGADLPLDRGPRVGVGCCRKGCLLAGVDRLTAWVGGYGDAGAGCD